MALDYNEVAADGVTYDQCGIDLTGEVDIYGQQVPDFNSGWTQVFKFQAILYTILVCMTVLSFVALFIPGVSVVLLLCVNCAIIPALAAIILTGIRRMNLDGSKCARSLAITEPDTGATFADNGATLRALFIAQCVMYLPTLCCLNCGFKMTLWGDLVNADQGTGFFKQ